MAAHIRHHDHVHTLGSLKSISIVWKIPYRYLSRLSRLPGFPQPYRFAGSATSTITTADYLYSREAVREYLADHLRELPQDDVSGYGSVKTHLKQKVGRHAIKRTQ